MTAALPRTILRGPSQPEQSARSRVVRLIVGTLLFLPYLLLAWLGGCPGLSFRFRCWSLAMAHAIGKRRLPAIRLASLVIGPLDSVRYFEFAFAQECLDHALPSTYLDVSSPRLFPVLHLTRHPNSEMVMLNPDRGDLAETTALVSALGVTQRCRLEGRLISESGLSASTFDVITSLSVVEHIPDDTAALTAMWGLLRPGGRLVLTVPCAAKPYEEWADFNKYGLLDPSAEGLVFWQRFYSQACLETRIFAALGTPVRAVVYGERQAGNYDRNVQAKMHDAYYPIWREPWMMAREWRTFETIDQMPGVGVIGLMFVKPRQS
jgi:hypothetical protein